MSVENNKFFELLAAGVAAGQTVREKASEIGCSEAHGYQISRTDEFKARVAELRTEMVRDTVGKLSIGSATAADTLVELLGVTNSPKDRLNAAKAILASVIQMTEVAELRERIDRLEQAQRG